jgi:HSF-type DNA-binding
VTELVKDRSRKEMFDAMENWVEPGKEPDFHQSGKGSALSEKLLQKKMGKEIIPGKQTVGNENDCENEEPCVSETPQGDPKRLRGRVPEDIRDMLDQAKAERAEHVVSWLLHGKAFAIHNRPLFMERFMPRFFKSKKFCYFSDVIRSWGFVRLKESKDKGAYYHKLFRRDAPRATLHLSRKQMKDSMSDWLSPDGKEPNLYEGISEDIIRASEQMQSLRGRTKKKRARKKKDGATEPRKKARKTVSVEGEDVSVNGKILPVEAKTAEV